MLFHIGLMTVNTFCRLYILSVSSLLQCSHWRQLLIFRKSLMDGKPGSSGTSNPSKQHFISLRVERSSLNEIRVAFVQGKGGVVGLRKHVTEKVVYGTVYLYCVFHYSSIDHFSNSNYCYFVGNYDQNIWLGVGTVDICVVIITMYNLYVGVFFAIEDRPSPTDTKPKMWPKSPK